MNSTRPYRHGNLPVALLAAARQILDENGLQAVGLRETARRVGVSATAAYRHFTSKEDLLASVAAEGFHELAAAMQSATRGATPLTRAGLAYIEFADQNRGLFRLMFGPILAERTKYPALQAASVGVEDAAGARRRRPRSAAAQRQPCGDGRMGPRAWTGASDCRRLLPGGESGDPGGGDPGQSQIAEAPGFGAGPIGGWRGGRAPRR